MVAGQEAVLCWRAEGGEAMARVEVDQRAPDFTLADFQGNQVSLSDFRGDQHVVLVFNRGFI